MQVIKPGGVNGFGMRIVMKIPSQSLYSYFIVQAYVMISLQMNYYSSNSKVAVIHDLAPNFLRLCNIVTILICLPILNHLVVPCLQNAVIYQCWLHFSWRGDEQECA